MHQQIQAFVSTAALSFIRSNDAPVFGQAAAAMVPVSKIPAVCDQTHGCSSKPASVTECEYANTGKSAKSDFSVGFFRAPENVPQIPNKVQKQPECGLQHSDPAVVGRKSGLAENGYADSCTDQAPERQEIPPATQHPQGKRQMHLANVFA